MASRVRKSESGCVKRRCAAFFAAVLAGLHAVRNAPADPRTLPRIIEAFVAPVLALRASAEGEYYALLVARELFHATEEADRVLRAFFDPLAMAYIDALQIALPHATRGQVAWGYQFALGALFLLRRGDS